MAAIAGDEGQEQARSRTFYGLWASWGAGPGERLGPPPSTVARGAARGSPPYRPAYDTVGLVWARPKVDGLGPSARGGHTGALRLR